MLLQQSETRLWVNESIFSLYDDFKWKTFNLSQFFLVVFPEFQAACESLQQTMFSILLWKTPIKHRDLDPEMHLTGHYIEKKKKENKIST